jgi:hypothetical protein
MRGLISPPITQGTSKGKGTTGVMKRWGFKGGPKSHGSSKFHRKGGSNGALGLGRVLKGKKMAGRMGNVNVTKFNLQVSLSLSRAAAKLQSVPCDCRCTRLMWSATSFLCVAPFLDPRVELSGWLTAERRPRSSKQMQFMTYPSQPCSRPPFKQHPT